MRTRDDIEVGAEFNPKVNDRDLITLEILLDIRDLLIEQNAFLKSIEQKDSSK